MGDCKKKTRLSGFRERHGSGAAPRARARRASSDRRRCTIGQGAGTRVSPRPHPVGTTGAILRSADPSRRRPACRPPMPRRNHRRDFSPGRSESPAPGLAPARAPPESPARFFARPIRVADTRLAPARTPPEPPVRFVSRPIRVADSRLAPRPHPAGTTGEILRPADPSRSATANPTVTARPAQATERAFRHRAGGSPAMPSADHSAETELARKPRSATFLLHSPAPFVH